MAEYKNNSGFTLVEMLVAVAIAAVVMSAVFKVYVSQQRSYVTQERIVAMHQNLRSAMYFMKREIRMAGYDPVETSGAGIVVAELDLIRFTMDIDDSGDISEGEKIKYTRNIENLDLERNGDPIAENISGLKFKYLQGDGTTPATGTEDVRFVEIDITAVTENSIHKSALKERIYLRNMAL